MFPSENATILVVEDDPFVRTSLSTVLSECGYCVRSVEDGFSALFELRNEIPDVILSDLHMPGMSGFELLAMVRIHYPGIAVVAMSGAFSGDAMPFGVTADFFHAKGESVGSLLQMLKTAMISRPMYRSPCCTSTIFSSEGKA